MGWLCLVAVSGCAQLVAPERMALNSIEKDRWEKAQSQLKKALRKDSLNASVKYVTAIYFFSPGNPAFQTDSAYYYTLQSLQDFQRSDAREKDRMKRFPLDSLILVRLREQIDSAAFEQASRINTEEAYLKFLSTYSFARQRDKAMELRDEVAYFNALKENTYQAFARFLEKYPLASHAEEARHKYERILYETKTKDKRLQSFEDFLEEFPNTPYRKDVELQIFELMTAGGATSEFEKFLTKYPRSHFARRARNFLFHILLEGGDEQRMSSFLNDSLRNVNAAAKKYLVPYFKDGKYGFIDQDGKEVIAPVTDEIDKSYLCGNVMDDILVLAPKVVAKNGAVIYEGDIQSFDDLGFGFLMIETGTCARVVHKSGAVIVECAESAQLLNGRMLAVRNNGQWEVFTLTGRKLPLGEWEEIFFIHDVFVFKRNKKYFLAKANELSASTNNKPYKFTIEYEDVKKWLGNKVWIKTNDLQGVLDQSLDVYIKLDRHVLTQAGKVDMAQSSSGYSFFNESGQQSVTFKKIFQNELWTAVKNQDWRLYDPVSNTYQSQSYDSILFAGPFAIGKDIDSSRVFFSVKRKLDVPSTTIIEFIPGKDSTSFLVTTDGTRNTVYNRTGQRLFTGEYDKIQYAGSEVFIVQKKDKKKKDQRGLIRANGKVLLPPEFDAIGSVTNGVVSLLKDKKFGIFNIKTLRQIKPEYSKNINAYSSRYLTAFDGKSFGFIGWDNKPLGNFEFEEIRYWNDTVSWVRKSYQWMLYNIRRHEVVEDQIKDYFLVVDTREEKIAIIHQDGHYGVISNKKDEIIPITLSRIVNVGSAEQPMYFTAKRVEEASIYVVIYYDKNGVLLRRQVYEDADYARIYCSSR